MIKAVIFDFGGVILRTEDHTPRRNLEARLSLEPGQSEALVFFSEMGQQAQGGAITESALWAWIKEQLRLDCDGLVDFMAAFWSGDVLDRDLEAAIRRLRPRYQTAMISNAMDGLRSDLEEKWQIADAFDLIVVSAEEQVMKPDAEIFQRTLARLGRRPEECVFVDDSLDNVQAARDWGLATVHVRPGTDVPGELKEILS